MGWNVTVLLGVDVIVLQLHSIALKVYNLFANRIRRHSTGDFLCSEWSSFLPLIKLPCEKRVKQAQLRTKLWKGESTLTAGKGGAVVLFNTRSWPAAKGFKVWERRIVVIMGIPDEKRHTVTTLKRPRELDHSGTYTLEGTVFSTWKSSQKAKTANQHE